MKLKNIRNRKAQRGDMIQDWTGRARDSGRKLYRKENAIAEKKTGIEIAAVDCRNKECV